MVVGERLFYCLPADSENLPFGDLPEVIKVTSLPKKDVMVYPSGMLSRFNIVIQELALFSESRRDLRTASDAIVVMSHPGFGTITVKAHDLSDGGIAVNMGIHICPPTGTVVDVIIKRHKGALNTTPIPMIVKHIQPNGLVGLAFI